MSLQGLTLALILVGPVSGYAATQFYLKGKEISKLEALKTLIKEPNSEVMKCQAVEISPKATLVSRKTR